MYDYFFTFRSITRAQQAVLALRSYGIAANMERMPKQLSPGGCGYGIFVRAADAYPTAAKLRKEGIAFEKVFRLGLRGELEEAAI